MRALYYLLPLLGSVALAAESAPDGTCQCPQVKCSSDDAAELCQCLNNRETLCKKRCPKYEPTYVPCPISPPTTPTLPPYPALPPPPTPKPKICECPLVNCIASWPAGCHCANAAAQKCYDVCGGDPPFLPSCELDTFLPLPFPGPIIDPVPLPAPVPVPEAPCTCDSVMCVQSWPESCYCANSAARQCAEKCGDWTKLALQECPPQSVATLITLTKSVVSTSTPIPTPSPTLLPPNTHKLCGGNRLFGSYECEPGYICITDPYTPGCGPACDGLGICVEDKMCGGFAGWACKDRNQMCHDDPRDDCNPGYGGADCAGLCVTPHRSLYADSA